MNICYYFIKLDDIWMSYDLQNVYFTSHTLHI